MDPHSQALFDAADEAVFVLDEAGVALASNDLAAHAFGLASKDALLGRSLFSLLPPDTLGEFRKELSAAFSQDEPLHVEGEILGRTYRMAMTTVKEQDEKRVVVFSRDVTDEKRADEHLRREQQRQIFYMESLPGFVATVDQNLTIRYANRAFRQRFGKPAKDGTHASFAECELNADRGALCRVSEILKEPQQDTWEWETPDGQTYQLFGHPMTDVDGSRVVMLLGFDITHRRAAERALLQAQAHQRAILDSVPSLVWLKDKDCRFREVNSAYAAACGRSSKELEGLDEVEVWGAEQGAFFFEQDQEVIRSGKKRVEDVEFRDASGATRWVESTRVPLFDGNGEVIGLAGISHDITSRKEVQDELRYSNEELEQRVRLRTRELEESNEALRRESKEHKRTADKLERARKRAESLSRAKSDFLANVSHEIRTPLNAILGAAELAELAESPEESQRYLEIIRLSGKTLSNLVNDILDFSKMEAYRLRLEHVPFDLYALLRGMRDSMAVVAQEGTIGVRLEINDNLPQWVKGDPVRLRQILDNLVGNAIKFTREGEVVIKASSAPGANDVNGFQRLLFSVSDTGIGIPLDKQSVIFKDFEQADTSISREYGGTGLGLAISRKLVETMGGNIAVVSEEGRGSTFSFTIQVGKLNAQEMQMFAPDVAGADEAQRALLAEGESRGVILVVDDNAMNQELMRMALGTKGYTVHNAYSGEDALEFLSVQPVDLVLMDIQMPEMDGLTAVKKLRKQRLAVPSDVPVIAMTAHALPGDRERMIKAGCDDYLAKPVDMKELFGIMERYLSGRPRVAAQIRGASGAGEENDAASVDMPLGSPADQGARASNDPRHPDDVRRALSLLGNRTDLLHRLEEVYVRQGPKDVEAMRDALRNGARDDLKRLVHLFKSTAATVGDRATSEIARSMEPLAMDASEQELFGMVDMIAESSGRMVEWLGKSNDGNEKKSS
ncbi:PAS domain-containing hybrid sensor histidine kinase/response regulator [Oceanidesulfovibrio indonesiensis]|nr:PAS domain-containing hybrid sensor histidine kinase/response regulator [Oceanidesulfovibrio indonesiensis]